MFRSCCPQLIGQRICRRAGTLCLNLHWNSQIHVCRSQVQLDLLPPLRRTDFQSEPPIQSCFSQDWNASEIAVHEDCDFVNVFLSSNSQCGFGFPNQIPRCTLQMNNVDLRSSVILWAKCFAISAKSNLSWAKSHARRSVSCYIFILQNGHSTV